jgi:hypothetical protein
MSPLVTYELLICGMRKTGVTSCVVKLIWPKEFDRINNATSARFARAVSALTGPPGASAKSTSITRMLRFPMVA